jgi:hypothetical protein
MFVEFVDVLEMAMNICIGEAHIEQRSAVNVGNSRTWIRYGTHFIDHPSQLCQELCLGC